MILYAKYDFRIISRYASEFVLFFLISLVMIVHFG